MGAGLDPAAAPSPTLPSHPPLGSLEVRLLHDEAVQEAALLDYRCTHLRRTPSSLAPGGGRGAAIGEGCAERLVLTVGWLLLRCGAAVQSE